MKKITLQQVADKAKISLSSASLAMNGSGVISDDVRNKVLSAAKELGYKKTSSEKTKRLSVVVLLMPIDEARAHSWNIFTRIIKACEEQLIKDGYYPVIIPVNNAVEYQYILEIIIDLNVDGVLSVHYADEKFYDYLSARKIPFVVINNSAFKHSAVLVDDFHGAYQACSKLLEYGHKNIAYFDYPRQDLPNIGYDRYLGYSKALMEAGLEKNNTQVTVALDDYAALVQGLKDCIENKKTPASAIMTHDDYMGIHVYRALQDLGYTIPRDISLIATGGGVLDYDLSYIPKITCTELDTTQLGAVAGELLVSHMKNLPLASNRLSLEQIYKERDTVAQYRK